MNDYFIKKHNLNIKKVTKIGNITIIDTPTNKYAFKNADIKTYDYLLSRGFNYIPKIIDYNDESIMFEYINNIDYKEEQKTLDYIKLLSLLHAKTIYYNEITNSFYKELYTDIMSSLININDYYVKLITIIESREYMSPCEYLVARNISNIFYIINYSISKLKEWYDLVKKSEKVRFVSLYNNIDLSNMIKSINGMYLTSFNNIKEDIPIYDLLNLYKKYYRIIDINTIIKTYEKVLVLTKEEKELLFILAAIPNKILINNSIESIKSIKMEITKINMFIKSLNFEKEEATSTHQEENN